MLLSGREEVVSRFLSCRVWPRGGLGEEMKRERGDAVGSRALGVAVAFI